MAIPIDSSTLFLASCTLLSLILGFLFLWKPLKGPREPPHVISYLPYLGSAVSMTSGLLRDFIAHHARRLRSPVFTAYITSKRCLFLADSSLVPIVFQDQRTELDSFSFQRHAMRALMGCQPHEFENVMEGTHIHKESMKQIHQYLLQTDELGKSMETVQRIMLQSPVWSTLSGETYTELNLYEFVQQVIFDAAVGALMSEGLMGPDTSRDFSIFEEGIPLLFLEMPQAFTRTTRQARERLIDRIDSKAVQDNLSDFLPPAKTSFNQLSRKIAPCPSLILACLWRLYQTRYRVSFGRSTIFSRTKMPTSDASTRSIRWYKHARSHESPLHLTNLTNYHCFSPPFSKACGCISPYLWCAM